MESELLNKSIWGRMPLIIATVLLAMTLPAAASGSGDHKAEKKHDAAKDEGQAENPVMMSGSGVQGGLLMPMMNPARGRKVFAAKGCVACHQLNGVGGDHGPSINMTKMGPMNPFEFAAKMWRGAGAMIALQEDELGEQIELSGQDLADIIAFVHSPTEIANFKMSDVPHPIADVLKRTHGEKPHEEGKGHDNKN